MGGSESDSTSRGRDVDDTLAHISEKPWSDYMSTDYTVEQWHAACLIHQHDGAPTSKGQCKLPVRTPSGVLNRNGVYSAAAALGGARGGVNASEDEKATAARALIRFYKEMDKEPPPSLLTHSSDQILAHYGKMGMRWGRRSRQSQASNVVPNQPGQVMLYIHPQKGIVKTSGGENTPLSEDAKRSATYKQISKKSSSDALSNKQLQEMFTRMDLDQKYSRLNPSTTKKGINFAVKMLKRKDVRGLIGGGVKIAQIARNDPRSISTGDKISEAIAYNQMRKAYDQSKKKKKK